MAIEPITDFSHKELCSNFFRVWNSVHVHKEKGNVTMKSDIEKMSDENKELMTELAFKIKQQSKTNSDIITILSKLLTKNPCFIKVLFYFSNKTAHEPRWNNRDLTEVYNRNGKDIAKTSTCLI